MGSYASLSSVCPSVTKEKKYNKLEDATQELENRKLEIAKALNEMEEQKLELSRIFCNFLTFYLEVKDHRSQGQRTRGSRSIIIIRVPYKGRWAHNKVKLLHHHYVL